VALTPATLSSLVRPAAWAAGVLSALTVTSKSTRDALFCAFFPAEALPKAMLAGAALSALFALATARTFRRHGPASVLSPLLWINALAFLVEHAMVEAAPRAVALILYLHVSGVTGLILSGFWSVVNERFDPHALRLSISRIGLGGTLGGFVGGVTAERIAAWAGARHTLLELCVLSGLAALTLGRLRAPSSAAPAVAALKARPLGSAYLRQIALFVALTALASSVIDFAFKARAMDRFTSPEELMQFFALFYTGVSLLSFLVQATLTPRLLDRLGLGAGLGGLPLALASAGVVALAWPGLVAQAVLRGADGALVGSLYRSSYEPLYTPIAPDDKRAAKAVIDVLVNRLGDGVGSLIVWGLVLLLPGAAALGANAVVALVAASALFVAVRLRQGYIDELARSLRSGAVVLDEWGVRDQTTRLTLSRTLSDLNRERLLAEIEIQHERTLKEESERARAASEGGGRLDTASPAESGQGVPALVADLLSENPARIQSALEHADPGLAPFVIPLIARDDVGAQAMNKLSSFGPRIIGQLSDALLDSERYSPKVRRRLVRVIATAESHWAAAALASALDDADFDVRRQAVRGLEDIAERGVQVPLARSTALEVALRELGSSDGVSSERSEHVLRLLGLVFDREAFRLARAALGDADPKLRGTALEYLDNVLPTPIKASLFSVLPPEPPHRTQRVEQELIDELRRTLA
jgi:ATP:ADP antiporter, AAA family